MDEKAADFGGVEFESILKSGNDLVDAGHGKVIRQGAVAVDLDAIVHAGDEDFVDVEDFGEGLSGASEADFELAVAFEGDGPLDGGGFAFDVSEDRGDFGDVAADV